MSLIYPYTQVGVDRDSNIYCIDCAEKNEDDDFSICYFWEGADEICSECKAIVKSEYGDPNENKQK